MEAITVQMDLTKVQAKQYHDKLPASVARDAAVLYRYVSQFDPFNNLTLKKYTDGFKRDAYPEGEIAWWQGWVKTVAHATDVFRQFPRGGKKEDIIAHPIQGDVLCLDNAITRYKFVIATQEMMSYAFFMMNGSRIELPLSPMKQAVLGAIIAVRRARNKYMYTIEEGRTARFDSIFAKENKKCEPSFNKRLKP